MSSFIAVTISSHCPLPTDIQYPRGPSYTVPSPADGEGYGCPEAGSLTLAQTQAPTSHITTKWTHGVMDLLGVISS